MPITGSVTYAPNMLGSDSGGQAGGDFKPLSRIEIIAPAAPGSGWDQTARAVQEAMKADGLARSVEVKNVPGASGTVALAQVAPQKGKSDLLIASGLAMMSGIITNGTNVTLDDLTPVARVVGEYEVIVVPKNVPYNNADELFAAIKADPKSVAIAGGSAGSADQIFIGLMAQHYGVSRPTSTTSRTAVEARQRRRCSAATCRRASPGSTSSPSRSRTATSRAC